MTRTLGLLAMLLALAPLGLAAPRAGGEKEEKPPADANLELELPDSVFSDSNGEYGSKLVIDGKDFTKAGSGLKRVLKVEPKKGKDSVKVVYTYWPYAYSKTVRTKVVKLEKGKVVKVSLLKEDKQTPDQIFPIYVPTPQEVVDEMCRMAKLTKDDVVCDIGCGDGRLCITAVKKFGAKKGLGWDIDPERIKECKENAKKDKVEDKVLFEVKDALAIKDYSNVSVVFLYVGEDLGKALEPTLRKTLKPGSRIVSHRFPLGDWKADKTVEFKAKSLYGYESTYTLLLWNVAKDKSRLKDECRGRFFGPDEGIDGAG